MDFKYSAWACISAFRGHTVLTSLAFWDDTVLKHFNGAWTYVSGIWKEEKLTHTHTQEHAHAHVGAHAASGNTVWNTHDCMPTDTCLEVQPEHVIGWLQTPVWKLSGAKFAYANSTSHCAALDKKSGTPDLQARRVELDITRDSWDEADGTKVTNPFTDTSSVLDADVGPSWHGNSLQVRHDRSSKHSGEEFLAFKRDTRDSRGEIRRLKEIPSVQERCL